MIRSAAVVFAENLCGQKVYQYGKHYLLLRTCTLVDSFGDPQAYGEIVPGHPAL